MRIFGIEVRRAKSVDDYEVVKRQQWLNVVRAREEKEAAARASVKDLMKVIHEAHMSGEFKNGKEPIWFESFCRRHGGRDQVRQRYIQWLKAK